MSQENRNDAQMNDFGKCLELSHKAADLPIWEKMYRQAFPGFAGMVDHRQNGEHQSAGIDRSVILESSKQILIDEKVRGRGKPKNEGELGPIYRDIALEHVSVHKPPYKDKPGWVVKPLRADYIAYAIAPAGIGYLLPVTQLQGAWRAYGKEWLRQYGEKPARNRGYVTLFCPVPVPVLFMAIGEQLRVRFTPFEVDEKGRPLGQTTACGATAAPGYLDERL